MSNEQNKAITIETNKKREPIELKTIVKVEGNNGKNIEKVHMTKSYSKIINRENMEDAIMISGECTVFALAETDAGEMIELKQEVNWQEKVSCFGTCNVLAYSKVVEEEVLAFDNDTITVNLLINLEVEDILSDEVSVKIEDEMGLEKDVETIEVSKISGACNTSMIVTDESEINVRGTIIARNVEAIIDSVDALLDSVSISGSLCVNALAFDGEKVETIKKVIPFKNEVECFGVNPGNQVIADVVVSKVMAGIRDEEGKNSILSIDAEMDAVIKSYQMQEVEIVKDLYSAVKDTNINVEALTVENTLKTLYSKTDLDTSISLAGRLGVDEVVAIMNSRVQVSSREIVQNTANIEGVIEFVAIYNNNDENNTQAFKTVSPFKVSVELDENVNSIDDFKFIVDSYKLKAGNEIQISGELFYSQAQQELKQIVYVSNVEYLEKENTDTSAIKVYVIKQGDRVFDIAKKLGVTVQNLLSQNPDLENNVIEGEKVFVYVPLVVDF